MRTRQQEGKARAGRGRAERSGRTDARPIPPTSSPFLVKGNQGRSASGGIEKAKERCGQWIQWGWGRHPLGKWGITSVDAIKPPRIFSWAAFQDGEIQSTSESHTSFPSGGGIKIACTAFSDCTSPPFKCTDTPSQ